MCAADTTTPPGTPPSQSTTLPTTPGQAGASTSSPSKRRYVVDTADADAVKKIKLNEIELSNRNVMLRGTKANVRSRSGLFDSCVLKLAI